MLASVLVSVTSVTSAVKRATSCAGEAVSDTVSDPMPPTLSEPPPPPPQPARSRERPTAKPGLERRDMRYLGGNRSRGAAGSRGRHVAMGGRKGSGRAARFRGARGLLSTPDR